MALRVKSERFRWHNYQWLEMMMGKTLNNEEAIDEDYLDPNFLHTAAELYDIPDMGHPGKVELEYGRNFDPFGKCMNLLLRTCSIRDQVHTCRQCGLVGVRI